MCAGGTPEDCGTVALPTAPKDGMYFRMENPTQRFKNEMKLQLLRSIAIFEVPRSKCTGHAILFRGADGGDAVVGSLTRQLLETSAVHCTLGDQ